MMGELCGLLLAGLVCIGVVVFGVNKMNEYYCTEAWGESGYTIKYGWMTGCRVSKDGVIFIPSENVREL